MQHLVDTYHDEWAEVVKDPAKRAMFKQFVNTDETIDKEQMIELVDMRGQLRPADWPKDGQPQTLWQAPPNDIFEKSEKSWIRIGHESEFRPNVGSPILYGETQLAVFNNEQRGEWYCTQNMCPHKQAFVLSQGLLGDVAGTPKVACPLHKKQFNLYDGQEIGAANPEGGLQILTFPIKVVDQEVFVELPSVCNIRYEWITSSKIGLC
jgi:nitrite reductase (NADH) large subunit